MLTTFRKLTWIELKLFGREPLALVFTLAFPLLLLVVLAGVFGSEPDYEAFGGLVPSDYYLAGYAAVVIGAIGLVAVPVHVAGYRERGILRRFHASSLPTTAVVGAQVAVGLAVATIGGAALVAAGALVFGAAMPIAVPRVLVAFLATTLAFLALGLLLGALARTARAAQALGMMLFFPMWLLSGAAPPPEVMGDTMVAVSESLPLTWGVRALQEPWLGGGSATAELLALAALAAVAGPLAVRLLRST